MKRSDIKTSMELYKELDAVDAKLRHIDAFHHVDCQVWASGSMGNYPTSVEIWDKEKLSGVLRDLLRWVVLAKRKAIEIKLEAIGAEVTDVPAAS